MTRSYRVGFAIVAVLALAAGAPDLRAQDMPPLPQPGPEHEIFKSEAGTWDATIEMETPGGPMSSKGVETNELGCGGRCLVTKFTGEFMPGMPFEGRGVAVYDAKKQKYVSTWTDSMSPGISMGEATWDPAAKTMTGWMEGPDMMGNITKVKSVTEHSDPDTRVFSMYGPDGAAGMTITYKRRK